LTGTYRLYATSSPSEKPVSAHWVNFELDDRPKAVTVGNGFLTLRPGESVVRDVRIVPACFETIAGARYLLRMPEGHGWIRWWGGGEIEAFGGVEVRATEWSRDGGLDCGRSNDVEIVA